MDFKSYLAEFEKKVFIEGFKNGVFEKRKEEIVTVKPGKLYKTPFGQFVGKIFEFDKLLSINYYGHFKISSEIINAIDSMKHIFAGVQSVRCQVIYFSSIKIDIVKELAPDLFMNYPEFKKFIVNLRWKK